MDTVGGVMSIMIYCFGGGGGHVNNGSVGHVNKWHTCWWSCQ